MTPPDSEIKPALTAEEWEAGGTVHIQARDGDLRFRVRVDGEWITAAVHGEDLSRTAALALSIAGPDGKPLFTHEDVAVIRHALLGWDGLGDRGDGVTDWISPRYPNADTLADRLSSLLPPEKP